MGPIVYDTLAANSANNITLFKGNAQYAIPPNTNPNVNPAATLSNAFLGRNQNGTESSLILSNGSITTNPLGAIPLVALGVRVSGAKV